MIYVMLLLICGWIHDYELWLLLLMSYYELGMNYVKLLLLLIVMILNECEV